MNEKQLVEILTTYYGIEEPALELFREVGGQTYIVNGKEKYLLKVIGTAFLKTAGQSVSIMRYLDENDFPVPKIILTKNGDASFTTVIGDEEKMIVLMEFIDGDEPNLKECASEVGALVGRFHHLMANYPVDPVSHGKEFFIERYLDFLVNKKYQDLSSYEVLGERLWERVRDLPRGNCHGDLHRGNLIQNKNGQIYLVDFDTVCQAPRMFDIMVMCDMTNYFDLKQEDIDITKDVFRRFLSGYSKYRVLSQDEILSFPDWVAIRHFQLQATILEIYGIDCIDSKFFDSQLCWLNKWQAETSDF